MECRYKCMKCGFEFIMPFPEPITCQNPMCKSLYVEWLNYKEVIAELKEKKVVFSTTLLIKRNNNEHFK